MQPGDVGFDPFGMTDPLRLDPLRFNNPVLVISSSQPPEMGSATRNGVRPCFMDFCR